MHLAPSALLDLYSLLVLRPDAHTQKPVPKKKSLDCLHFCAPGPQDVVGPLLQRLLQFG